LLLPQAERGRRDASKELSAARQQAAQLGQENADLQQRLAATQCQLRQLESLQSFADSWEDQQQRERQLTAALAQANGRVGQLERDLGQAAAALQAAQQLAAVATAEDSRERQSEHLRGRQDQQQHQQGQRAGSPSLSDLCDLGGAPSQFEAAGDGSPQSSSGQAGSSGSLPSRQRALQQQRQYQAEQQQRRRLQQEQEQVDAEAVGQEVPLSLAASLQQQLLEQQRQLSLLQVQQQINAISSQSGEQKQQQEQAGGSSQVAALELEVEKLKRRNTQLQTALAEASLQHARAAAAGQRQLAELQQEAAQLQQRRDEAQQQLAQLQAAASALGVDGAGSGGSGGGIGGCSSEQLEQLHGELLEYAGRCNAAVEQNTGVAATPVPAMVGRAVRGCMLLSWAAARLSSA
jgi:chromosome segregation ATPase